MNAVKDDVIQLVAKELASANEKFPLFHSQHEAYGEMLEEVRECEDEMKIIIDDLDAIWFQIRRNIDTKMYVGYLKEHAINLVCEAIQVVAMCDKWGMSFEEGDQ